MKVLMSKILMAFDKYEEIDAKYGESLKSLNIMGAHWFESGELLNSLCREMKQRNLPIALEQESKDFVELCKIVTRYFKRIANAYEVLLRKCERGFSKNKNE